MPEYIAGTTFHGVRDDFEEIARALEVTRVMNGETHEQIGVAQIIMGLSIWNFPASDENIAKVRGYLEEAWQQADAPGNSGKGHKTSVKARVFHED